MSELKTIILALQQEALRQQLQDFLQSLGYQAIKVDNGVDALAAVMNFRPHGIVLDADLPKIDGLSVAHLLRDAEDLRAIRIVLITFDPIDPKTLEKLRPALLVPVASFEYLRQALVSLELIPDVKALPPRANLRLTESSLRETIELMSSGQLDVAFDLLRSYTHAHPEDLKARGFYELCRTLTFRAALKELDNLQLRPRRAISDRQIMGLSLHSDEGFLLSFIDGVTRLRDLFFLGGYDRPTTYILLRNLLHRGVISLK